MDGGKNMIDAGRGVFLHEKCLSIVRSTPLDDHTYDGCIVMQNMSFDTSVTLSSKNIDTKK